jgi:hypothetical protein
MLRFLAGIAACLICQAVGYPRIDAALASANKAVKAAYHAALATAKGEQ